MTLAEVPRVLTDTQVVVAFVTFVLGPVLVVLVTNSRTNQKAKVKVGKVTTENVPPGEGRSDMGLVEAVLEWSERLRSDASVTRKQLQELRIELLNLKDRLARLEAENRLLRQLNAHNVAQLMALGGEPFIFSSDDNGTDQ